MTDQFKLVALMLIFSLVSSALILYSPSSSKRKSPRFVPAIWVTKSKDRACVFSDTLTAADTAAYINQYFQPAKRAYIGVPVRAFWIKISD